MANTLQVLRSRRAGARPGDGTVRSLLDGELFLNTADGVLGYLNAAGQTILGSMPGQPAGARSAITAAAYQILATDTLVAVTALPVSCALTLPPAASYDPRQSLVIQDESGAPNPPSPTITITCSGSDIIVTGGNVTSASIASPGQRMTWRSDGVSKWTYA